MDERIIGDDWDSLDAPSSGDESEGSVCRADDVLAKVDLFDCLGPEARRTLIRSARRRSLAAREVAFCDEVTVYVVLSGGVKVIVETEDGHRLIETVVDEGGTFGSLAGPPPDHRVVEALDPTELLLVPRRTLWRLVTQNPQLALAVIEDQARERHRLERRVEGLAFRKVERRVVEALLAWGQPHTDGQGWLVDTRLSRQDLADLVGASRETVSRVLGQLFERDLVEREGRAIRVPSVSRLKRMVRQPSW